MTTTPASVVAPASRDDATGAHATPALRGDALTAWAQRRMPALAHVRARLEAERPLAGLRIAGSLHITPETAAFVRCLCAAGARVALCGSNPLSTRDDVVAVLRELDGVEVHAAHGESRADYHEHLLRAAASAPHIVLDDGADLIAVLADAPRGGVRAGIEQTTTGVQRLRAMHESGVLPFGVVALNDSPLKQGFDSRYGTGQNTLDGIVRATNVLIAGKTFVVAGYGFAGRGIAERARGAGANVVVCEVDAMRALQAHHDGFRVMRMAEACTIADIIVTATGCAGVVGPAHLASLRDGVILANSGHFDVEIDAAALRAQAVRADAIRPSLTGYTLADGRTVHLLADGRLVGQSAAEASPADVMDLTFALMALTTVWAASATPVEGIVLPPGDLVAAVAAAKLEALGLSIDELSPEQRAYVSSWRAGT